MRFRVPVSAIVGSFLLLPMLYVSPEVVAKAPRASRGRIEPLNGVAVRFEPNAGQFAPDVEFVARGGGGTTFVHGDSATFRVARRVDQPQSGADVDPAISRVEFADVRLQFSGARAGKPVGLDRLPGVTNYLVGQDPALWRTGIPGFARVVTNEVLPGIDLGWTERNGRLSIEILAKAGADPSLLRLAGHPSGVVTKVGGSLVLATPLGQVELSAPTVSQPTATGKWVSPGAYRTEPDGGIAVDVGAFDATRSLGITIEVTFPARYGGAGSDSGAAISVASDGTMFVAGTTDSTDFPTVDPAQGTRSGSKDACVSKIAPNGDLLFSTYVGGSMDDFAEAIFIDPSSGSAVVAGYTQSSNFPTHNPAQATYGGGFADAFAFRLEPSGDAFAYSTFIGGSDSDFGLEASMDGAGLLFVGGTTGSANFPSTRGAQTGYGGGFRDGFLTAVGRDGSIAGSSLIGGNDIDTVADVEAADGVIWVSGQARSTDFATPADPDNVVFVAQIRYEAEAAAAGERLPVPNPIRMYYDFQQRLVDDLNRFLTYQATRLARRAKPFVDRVIHALVTTENPEGQVVVPVPQTVPPTAPVPLIRDTAVDIRSYNYLLAEVLLLMDHQQAGQPGVSTPDGVSLTLYESGTPIDGPVIDGSGSDVGTSMDGSPGGGDVYITGETSSTDLESVTRVANGQGGGGFDIFVAKVVGMVSLEPDFTLSLSEPALTAAIKSKGQIVVDIGRTGGFDGEVTVTPSGASAIKVKLTPATAATTGGSVTFNYKVKKKATPGTYTITFTGRDREGRERSTTLSLTITPT